LYKWLNGATELSDDKFNFVLM